MGQINMKLPDEVHDDAKAAASLRGDSLKQFVVDSLRETSEEVLRNRVTDDTPEENN